MRPAGPLHLSLQDRLAVMMTGTVSLRALERETGISHQRLGRWLTIGQNAPDGSPSRVKVPTDKAALDAIDAAFLRFTAASKAYAKSAQLPFDDALPVFARRVTLKDGSLGDRVVIGNTHRLRDDLRSAAIANAHISAKYFAVSVRSIINVFEYPAMRHPHPPMGSIQEKYKAEFDLTKQAAREQLAEDLGVDEDELDDYIDDEVIKPIYPKPVFIPKVSLNPKFSTRSIVSEVNARLRVRHESATGDPGTAFADEIVFQIDPEKDTISKAYLKRKSDEARTRKLARAKERRFEQAAAKRVKRQARSPKRR